MGMKIYVVNPLGVTVGSFMGFPTLFISFKPLSIFLGMYIDRGSFFAIRNTMS